MRQCKHFNGIQNDRCSAGVCYTDLTGKDHARALPCITLGGDKRPAECDKYQMRTPEEEAAEEASMEAAMERFRKVMPTVSEWRKKPPRGKQEVIECPACKGRLHLSQSSYNGHVHGQCETEGCVSWME